MGLFESRLTTDASEGLEAGMMWVTDLGADPSIKKYTRVSHPPQTFWKV